MNRTRTLERGWTLPVVMFGTALLLGWVRLLMIETTATGIALPILTRGETFRAQGRERVSRNIALSRMCDDISSSQETIETIYTRCSEGIVPFQTKPTFSLPQKTVDYDALFALAGRCSTPPSQASPSSGGSPQAPATCLLPPTVIGDVTLLDNLKGDTVSVITQNAEAALMASPGCITITNTLSISQDLLIVSGGEVHISTLQNTSDTHRRVTIISSLGTISVGRVAGPLSLLVVGRSTIQAPETPPSTTYPLPPMRSGSLRGFSAHSSLSPF